MVSTVGAPLRWVMPRSQIIDHASAGSALRRQTCVAPAAVTPQVKHQPSQWNMGSVHRYALANPMRVWWAIASACK